MQAAHAFLTLLAALLAGWAVAFTGLPLGWLIGAMLVMIAAALLHIPAVQPASLMPWVKAAVGAMLGASIPAGLADHLGQMRPTLLVMFLVMTAAGLINFRMLRGRFGFGRMDAALCSMPGGIAEMILQGERAGGDPRRIAIVHALRISLSILAIPILAKGIFGISVASADALPTVDMKVPDWLWFGLCVAAGVAADRWTRLPVPLILVPLALSAAVHLGGISAFHVPPEVSRLVQVMIGMNVGARFLGIAPRALAAVGVAACAVVAVQLFLALAAAVVLARAGLGDALALLLAYAPGGLAEMSLIAIAMGRETAFVAFHHIIRVLCALFAAPPLLKRLGRSDT
ncbi:AbrB family transcriptional regulator [Paracoccus homiensis]|uniref:AbrB family transcriptional regulator n=1 Tax=Paracoccus homiensis TaxID=364199 RepID=UPI00398D50A8